MAVGFPKRWAITLMACVFCETTWAARAPMLQCRSRATTAGSALLVSRPALRCRTPERVRMAEGQDDDRFVAYFALVAIGGYTAILAYEFIRLKLGGEI